MIDLSQKTISQLYFIGIQKFNETNNDALRSKNSKPVLLSLGIPII